MAKPVSVKVDTFGTGDERAAAEFVMNSVRLPPARDHRAARTCCARSTASTTNYGHFGRTGPAVGGRREGRRGREVDRGEQAGMGIRDQPDPYLSPYPSASSSRFSIACTSARSQRHCVLHVSDSAGREIRVRL